MYAIVDILGKQFKIAPGAYVYAPSMEGEEGDAVTLDKVLLVSQEDGVVKVGSPALPSAKAACKILSQVRGNKVIVFKKNRRKGYKVKRGHRQAYTKLQVESISA